MVCARGVGQPGVCLESDKACLASEFWALVWRSSRECMLVVGLGLAVVTGVCLIRGLWAMGYGLWAMGWELVSSRRKPGSIFILNMDPGLRRDDTIAGMTRGTFLQSP